MQDDDNTTGTLRLSRENFGQIFTYHTLNTIQEDKDENILSKEEFGRIFDSFVTMPVQSNGDINIEEGSLLSQPSTPEVFVTNVANINVSSVEHPTIYLGAMENIPYSTEHPSTNDVLAEPLVKTSPCLPARNNWDGQYGFNVSFPHVADECKKAKWVYSEERDKLFVCKDEPCPVNFMTNKPCHDAFVRIRAVFTKPEDAKDRVSRCVQHTLKDQHLGSAALHVIHCEYENAEYQADDSGQLSVVVPYIPLKEYSPEVSYTGRYLFKFVCYGSCKSGLNRRPLTVIFSLEKGGQALGRRSIDVKICACPSRDSKNEYQQHQNIIAESKTKPSSSCGKRKRTSSIFNSQKEHAESELSGQDIPSAKRGKYQIIVNSKKKYESLMSIKALYDITQKSGKQLDGKQKKEESSTTDSSD